MWCDNCNRQFDTDEKNCPECGKELIDSTPISDDNADEILINIEARSLLLVTVIGEKEAKRIIDFLNENHIPASCKVSEDQSLDDLDGIEWDDEDFEDDLDENFDGEEYETETLTPPQTEEEDHLNINETLYDILVPETDFPEAMSLLLENDKDRDATIIDEINIEDMDSDIDFVDEVYEEIEEILEEEDEPAEENLISDEGEKFKGGFWNLFRK